MIFPLTHRSVVALSGDDRLKFIQGLITQDINLLHNGHPLIYGLLLSTKGRIQFDLFIFQKDNILYLDTDRGDDLVNLLKIYKLRSDINIIKTDIHVFSVIGQNIIPDMTLCFKDPRHIDMGYRFYSIQNIECDGSIDDYDNHRLPLNIPDGQKDLFVNKTLPLEWKMDDLSAISFTKGCYLGQELTARTKHTAVIRKTATVCSINDAHYQEALLSDTVISVYKNYAFIWDLV